MKKDSNNNIEVLFEAAKRHEKDLQRQQRLSDLVDQWATAGTATGATTGSAGKTETASETATQKSHNRKPIWTTIGVAAGILLMVSIGLRALQPQTPEMSGTLVAVSNPSASINSNTTSEEQSIENDLSMAGTKSPTQSRQHRATNTEPPLLAEKGTIEDGEQAETIETIEPVATEEILIAANESHESETTTVTATGKKRVFERTSNRLVRSNIRPDIRPDTRPSSNNPEMPLLAFSGTGTSVTYELGKINF